MRIMRIVFWQTADDFNEMSYLIFFENKERMSQNLSLAAIVIGISKDFNILKNEVKLHLKHFSINLRMKLFSNH